MDKKNFRSVLIMDRKICKFILNFIPSKSFRKKMRKKNEEIEFKKEIQYIDSEKGKKELNKIEIEFPEVLTTTETLNEILNSGKSISRFGDGELNIVLFKKSYTPYQILDTKLKKRLIEILSNGSDEKVLVCIPPFNYKKIKNFQEILKKEPARFFERYWIKNFNKLKKYFKDNSYGNAFISRIHFFYDNKLEDIKKVWDNKNVVLVYSKSGRFEMDKRIFDNIFSYEEILVPATNAYDKYEDILAECLSKGKKNIFIIAAGPMATVLAYDLAKKGYQALDIGHFPNCYREFLGEMPKPEVLPVIKDQEM